MTRFKWTAWQKGRIIDDGVVEAATERDGIRDLLSSRQWPGHDWRLRVGSASITFDEEDVAKLAGEVGNDQAKDTALPGKPVLWQDEHGRQYQRHGPTKEQAARAMPSVRETL